MEHLANLIELEDLLFDEYLRLKWIKIDGFDESAGVISGKPSRKNG